MLPNFFWFFFLGSPFLVSSKIVVEIADPAENGSFLLIGFLTFSSGFFFLWVIQIYLLLSF